MCVSVSIIVVFEFRLENRYFSLDITKDRVKNSYSILNVIILFDQHFLFDCFSNKMEYKQTVVLQMELLYR